MKIFKDKYDKNDEEFKELKKTVISMVVNFIVFETFWFALLYFTFPKLLG